MKAERFCVCEPDHTEHDFPLEESGLEPLRSRITSATSCRRLAMPKTAQPWSLTSLREKLIKIGAKVVSQRPWATDRDLNDSFGSQTREIVADRGAAGFGAKASPSTTPTILSSPTF